MKTFNDILDEFLKMTLWVWLPFYVLPILFKQVQERFRQRSAK